MPAKINSQLAIRRPPVNLETINIVSLADLNQASSSEFSARVGSVFEGSPWIAEAGWLRRPFGELGGLHASLCAIVREAGIDQQLALIRAHPDLVGRAALAGTLTPASISEQAAAGLDRLSPAEIEKFQKYNQAYREKFGFPFVICARLNKKEAILKGFEMRLAHTREEEIRVALEEIYKIAYLRLQDMVKP
jgi:2-oxo-4-hydroxy-4-carboxy-5-ureidoimidazoline decarboxylase